MLDGRMRRMIDPIVDRLAGLLSRLGCSANAVTLIGFGIGILAGIALAYRAYELALAAILLNRVADGLDGALARRLGPTDLGAYLDIVLDFLIYSGLIFGFAVGQPESALAAAFLIFSFVGTGSSFLAFAILAAKRGESTTSRGKKGIYYLSGLAEGTETIAVLVLICLRPDWFVPIAYTFGGICWLTTLLRILEVAQRLRLPPPQPESVG
ncbi:CDP-alcohol phosphatidyltransferase family protein [Tuwongella immobilis]|uniref:CDP-alcohol phosphatidyltransferase n=1 Tax=Tuwongella immobilis TaxID=692036 RepID=A0A6C2YVD3_9BACT|nr:CDP-alcohol phosphatidyltransferase family protein [Tuwongella immobilis]VIP05456.1 membrane protein : Phosphatidylglycerophosphate synthase OS=alpha proteobacterium BAL199 GN=BAL199_01799 PE=3 SV=1: CDP-OH_P_transf [Tuwongella immobilis]VTS08268.1 membrane protein : Phosphatidylglycerophosphate synthase OS=alpha proteobacterium BAL199 GN=BAL199_01799 PE=3 SV=1: CDP-OH_P_transf [Tuwongella immobilis]